MMSNKPETMFPNCKYTSGQHYASFWKLTLGAIGVVYGDIGTSPLYAVRESVLAAVGPGKPASNDAVLGILSLIIWALLLVVTTEIRVILLRADNNGEGGTLALMALAARALGGRSAFIILLGIISGGAVLWRCDHYARALGSLRHRGHEDHYPGVRALCGPDHRL